MFTDIQNRLWQLVLLIVGLLVFGSGCNGPHPFKAETRFGWGPLTGMYFSDTKDNKARLVLRRDPTTGEWTEAEFDVDNRAETANASMVPLQDGYIRQLEVQNRQTELITRMFERLLQMDISANGVRTGAAAGGMNVVPNG